LPAGVVFVKTPHPVIDPDGKFVARTADASTKEVPGINVISCHDAAFFENITVLISANDQSEPDADAFDTLYCVAVAYQSESILIHIRSKSAVFAFAICMLSE
jgi:hypothetical protein